MRPAADPEASTLPDRTGDAGPPARPLPAVPFHTLSRWVIDANNERFKLVSVNWYGAESKDFVVAGLDKASLATIATQIRTAGFDSVRIPWSNELVETDPVVASARVSANPSLTGKHALEVLDAVIAALTIGATGVSPVRHPRQPRLPRRLVLHGTGRQRPLVHAGVP